MAHYISVDNGRTLMTATEAASTLTKLQMRIVVNAMDDDLREEIHSELAPAPCSDEEFLARYLERATDDIIIG